MSISQAIVLARCLDENGMSTAPLSHRVFELLRFTANHNRYANALARATGEHFNIFQILRIGHLEVKTHSPILGELLNPEGAHGQGAVFLRMFLTRFEISGFDAGTARVKTEYYAGPRTENSGGRIDIVIKDCKGLTIFIENKIYANDQDNQMLRYREFDQKAHLFYLTLDGREPNNVSEIRKELLDLRCISYAENILGWLDDCLKESAGLPTVRETIIQYIHLVRELTHQNANTRMNEELIKAVTENEEAFLAYMTLRKAEKDVYNVIFATLEKKLRSKVAELGLELDQVRPFGDLSRKESGFSITNETWKRNQLTISFAFDSGYWRNLYFGFPKPQQSEISKAACKLKELFNQEFGYSSTNQWWLAWKYWDEHRNWDEKTFAAIQFGDFADDLKKLIERLSRIANRACGVE